MARRRKGDPVDGWVAIDKPLGLTSTQVVGRVRRALNAQKAGHGGTLDPLATGVLPIALGEATKTVPYVMDGEKAYRFTLRWGEARDTDDQEGRVIATADLRPDRAAILAVLPRFIGLVDQVPPRFSAIKVDGQRAYDLARAEAEVELAPRTVRIDALDLADLPDPDHAVFEVRCGKGTYMRSLARDIALALGTVGHVAALRRTRCGPFTEDTLISLDKVEGLGHSPAPFMDVLPIETALVGIPALALTEPEAIRLANGQAVSVLRLLSLSSSGTRPPWLSDDGKGLAAGPYRIMCGRRLVAIARIEDGALRPVRIIHSPMPRRVENHVDHG